MPYVLEKVSHMACAETRAAAWRTCCATVTVTTRPLCFCLGRQPGLVQHIGMCTENVG